MSKKIDKELIELILIGAVGVAIIGAMAWSVANNLSALYIAIEFLVGLAALAVVLIERRRSKR